MVLLQGWGETTPGLLLLGPLKAVPRRVLLSAACLVYILSLCNVWKPMAAAHASCRARRATLC